MTYTVLARLDGEFDLVLMKPVRIGTFPDQIRALRVAALLNDDDLPPEPVPEVIAVAVAAPAPRAVPATAPFPPVPPHVAKAVAPVADALPALLPPPAPVSVAAVPGKLTADQKAEAFALLEAGAALGDVALRFGVSFNHLCAVWAGRPKPVTAPGTALVAKGRPTALALVAQEQAPCRLCREPFTDTCARCSRDL